MEINHPGRVAFYTLGCKVNQYDTQAMLEQFVKNGYTVVDFESDADVYIVNTCTVTNLGDRKSRQMIRRAHRRSPQAVIAVVGCYAQTASDEVSTIPGVNLVMGTKDRDKIVEMVEKVRSTGVSLNGVTDIMRVREFEEMPIASYEGKTRAVLKIQEGCNQFCAYCIIPYARGPVRSRHPEDVEEEVKRLVMNGFREIVLTGIHLASYGKDLRENTLLSLLERIHQVEGLARIRLGSLEPTLFSHEFVQGIKRLPKVCRHFHISLQSGSRSTLKRMNRRYTPEDYLQFVDRLRREFPRTAVTTDIMVGFPGETEEEFEETCSFVQRVRFSKIHVFQYSPREGTPAASFPDQVPSEEKESRSRRLIALGHEMEGEYLKSFLGQVEKVLFEEQSAAKENFYEGYTEHYVRVMAEGNDSLEGKVLPVLLTDLGDGYVVGEVESISR